MKSKLLATASLIIALPLSTNALAHHDTKTVVPHDYKYESVQTPSPSRFYMGAYMGYGSVNNMLSNDGQSALGRLTFGYKAYAWEMSNRASSLAVELGLQNGKLMRHAPAPNDPDVATALPIQTTLNPVLDLLAALNVQFAPGSDFYGIVKAGIAYRQLQFPDGDYISSLNQISPELQLGIGYVLSQHTRIVAYYQGIYADGNVKYRMNTDTTVTVSNIPTQQAGFLGFEVAL